MLTVHHLGRSQSERIVWLCEELGLAYDLVVHDRDATTRLAPAAYKALHPSGTAPVIVDGPTVLGESGAIVDYILARYGNGNLVVDPESADFADYLYWLHFTNGTLQPALGRCMILSWSGLPEDAPMRVAMNDRLSLAMRSVDARLADAPYLAGEDFTVADIMIVFSLTTMRLFLPFDLAPYPHILAYLQRVGARPAYRRAMEKGDPGLIPMLT